MTKYKGGIALHAENSMCDDWWNMNFDSAESFTRSIPTVGVVGNHETGAVGQRYFNLHFLNPENGHGLVPDEIDSAKVNNHDRAVLEELDNTVYSFDYGNVHFAVLNTGSDWMKTSYVMDLQTEWLKKDIETSNKKWNVVLLHIGVYPAQNRGRVSHVNGTVYSILGCAGLGTTRYDYSVLPSENWIEVVKTTGAGNPTYNIMTFKEDSITVLSKALDGTVIDSYTLTK